MNSRQTLETLLAQFAQAAGISGEPLNEQGVAAIGFDQDIVVNVAAYDASDLLHLFATLGLVPDDDEAMHHAMQLALCFNRDLIGIRSGAIGLTPDEREFVLSTCLPLANLTAEEFSLHLLAFAELCRQARIYLAEAPTMLLEGIAEQTQEEAPPDFAAFV